ncbi:MAG: hypothetical protein ACXAC7_02280 [Candidatus Hodarchaeales archaeon]|jgi:hypothetical protein
MSDVDEETLETIRRHCRQLAIQNEGNASFRDVMLSLGKELDRDVVRKLIPVIKKEIEDVNSKSLEDLKAADDADDEGVIENEYDELATNFRDKMEGKSYVSSLLAYGSYGKGNHIMGQSNLNFLLILEDMNTKTQEKVGKEIKEIIESLMNPLYEYLFDLVILFDRNVASLEAFKQRMGPGFTAVHAFSASQCTPLIGENPFKELEGIVPEIENSAKLIITDTINQYREGKRDVEEEGSANTDDLAYISSEAIIDYALALIYHQSKDIKHVTKPDIRDQFKEIFKTKTQFKPFIGAVEQAFAYRMGISKIGEGEITETDLIINAEKFTKELEKFIKK